MADVKEDALEALYEKRLRKKSAVKENEDKEVQRDSVDALPVKTLDGKLYYRTSINFSHIFAFPWLSSCIEEWIVCFDCWVRREWFVFYFLM